MALLLDQTQGHRPAARPSIGTEPSAPVTHSDNHLWQIDILRLLTFAAVIAVHTIGNTGIALTTSANGTLMLLQFGREVFFTLTAFVLVFAAIRRPVSARPFWRKRFTLVFIPYLTWSVIYELVRDPTNHGWSWTHFGYDLVTGTAEYHLYFLLVTMQLYLVFPLLWKFVRRTADHAVGILAVVTAANVAWLSVLQYVHPSSPTMTWFYTRAYELLPTYSMYVLAGAYAAVHYDRIQAFVERNRRRLLAVAGVSAVVAIGAYVAQLRIMQNYQASSVLQPAMIASCVAAVIVIYLIGNRWASGPRRGLRLVAVGSEISFGVYLAHPLVLKLLTDHGFGGGEAWAPGPVIAFIAYLLTAIGATAIAYAVRRTPFALPLGGRPRQRRPAPVTLAAGGPVEATVALIITARAARDEHQVVFVEGATGRVLTAGDLDRAAEAWRRVADSVGDARVGLAVADPLDMVRAYLGALATGVTIAPLDPNATTAEYGSRFAALGLSALITDCPEAAAAATASGIDLWRTGRPAPVQLVARYRGERPSGGRAALDHGQFGNHRRGQDHPADRGQPLGHRPAGGHSPRAHRRRAGLQPAAPVPHQRPGGRRPRLDPGRGAAWWWTAGSRPGPTGPRWPSSMSPGSTSFPASSRSWPIRPPRLQPPPWMGSAWPAAHRHRWPSSPSSGSSSGPASRWSRPTG